MTQTMSFGYDGDGGLGDRLLAAALCGDKTATSSLAVEYLSGDPLPRVGERVTLVDHHGRPHGIVETTRVRIIPLHLVGDDVARDEGEGFADAADWRRAHVSFRDEPGTPEARTPKCSPYRVTLPAQGWWVGVEHPDSLATIEARPPVPIRTPLTIRVDLGPSWKE